MDWSEIITYISSATRLSPAELANQTGVSNKYIHDLRTGKSKNPKTDFIKALVKNLNVNPSWLLTGEGPMFIQSQEPTTSKAFPDQMGNVSHLEEGLIDPSEMEHVIHSEMGNVLHFEAVPDRGGDLAEEFQPAAVLKSGTRLMGRRKIEVAMEEADPRVGFVAYVAQPVSAGPGRDLEALYETARLPVMLDFIYPWRPDQVIALQVRGDSMTGVGIFDFDIVLYVPTRREKDDGDGIYVISVDNKMLVKRLEFDLFNGHIRIISENERYSPKELRGEDSDRMTIEGKVIGWLHRHPY